MNTIETGGPAFPMQEPQAIHAYAVSAIDGITDPDERDRAYLKARAEAVGGASLRDYFAAKAMQGDWAAQGAACGMFVPDSDDELFARSARMYFRMADAMLAARKSNPSQ